MVESSEVRSEGFAPGRGRSELPAVGGPSAASERSHGRRRYVTFFLAAILAVAGCLALTLPRDHVARTATVPSPPSSPVVDKEPAPAPATPTITTTTPAPVAAAPTPPATPTKTTTPTPVAAAPAPAPAAGEIAVTEPSVATMVAEVEASGVEPGSNWSWSMGDTATHCGARRRGTGCTFGAGGLEYTVFAGSPTLALVAHELANAETQNDAVPDLLNDVATAADGTSWSPTDAVASCLVEHFMGFQDGSAGSWQCPTALATTVADNIHDTLSSTIVGQTS